CATGSRFGSSDPWSREIRKWRGSSCRLSRSGCATRRPSERDALRDDAVDLEDLGVVPIHVDPVRARDVADVLRVAVSAVLLRGVLRERSDLLLDVLLVERDVRLVGEVEVVPGNLVAEDRRPLERAKALR